jgi:hypothetical protein
LNTTSRSHLTRRRWAVLLIAVCLTGLLLSEVALRWLSEPRIAGRWALVVITAAFLVEYFRTTFRLRVAPEIHNEGRLAEIAEIDGADIDRLYDGEEFNRVGFEQFLLFAQGVLSPRTIFHRISEDVTQFHRSTMIKSTFTVSFAWAHDDFAGSKSPSSSGYDTSESRGDFVVPLIVPAKGEVLDGLRVFDDRDGRVSTLTVTNQIVFSLAVLRMFVNFGSPTALPAYMKELEPEVIRLLRRATPAADKMVRALVRKVNALPGMPKEENRVLGFGSMLSALNRWQPICATVPAEAVAKLEWPYLRRLRLERRFVGVIGPAPSFARGRIATMVDLLRMALDVRLAPIYVPLANAVRSASYHLQVAGPEGTYLAGQAILGRRPQSSRASLQPRRGQRRAHLYARDFRLSDGTHLATEFHERAPGSLASASLAALAAALVVGVLAMREVFSPILSSASVPLASTLLAVPIGVAALAGIDPSKEKKHPSLLSRFVSLSTILTSLLGFGLIVLSTTLDIEQDVTARLWTFMAFVSTGVAIVSCVSWFTRLRVESWFRSTTGAE